MPISRFKNIFMPMLFLIAFCGVTFADVFDEIGLTTSFPADWKVIRTSRTDVTIEDTTLLMAPGDTSVKYKGLFTLSIFENILKNSSDAEDWSVNSGIAYKIGIESNTCTGTVFVLDTMDQDGLFTIYGNSEVSDCETDNIFRGHSRFVAFGDFGYELSVDADSLDMVKNFSYYMGLLDSIKLKRDFKEILLITTEALQRPSFKEMDVSVSNGYLTLHMNTINKNSVYSMELDVLDVMGRTQAKRVKRNVLNFPFVMSLGAITNRQTILRVKFFENGNLFSKKVFMYPSGLN